MSHKATHWLATIQPETITAGSFRVLFHLCVDDPPPSTALELTERTSIGLGSLFAVLDELCASGILVEAKCPIPSLSDLTVDLREQAKPFRNRPNTPHSLRLEIYQKNGGICQYCGVSVSFSAFHADHIFPWSKGGATSLENMCVSCGPCNQSKGAKRLDGRAL